MHDYTVYDNTWHKVSTDKSQRVYDNTWCKVCTDWFIKFKKIIDVW